MPAIPTGRLEAFSDGVIAIIITVMVFDLKLQQIPTEHNLWAELKGLLPRLLSYIVSFVMLAIMWVNHHQMFHQIGRTDRKLLWYNIHLLFWMSLIPFGTNFIGANPMLWQSSCLYGVIFFMCALAFTLMRDYVLATGLLHEAISRAAQRRVLRKNRIALGIYLAAALLSPLSVYLSFVLFLVAPAMYFMPENIEHET